MEPFKTVRSIAVPLPIKDVDTDMIIPAQHLTSISRVGFGEHLFSRLKAADPAFPFNNSAYSGAKILIADSNFGCGSSREHAVWALVGWGIRVVIAKSFADIFTSNSGKNGLLLVQLPAAVVDDLLSKATHSNYEISVDLTQQVVSTSDNMQWHFEYDAFSKHCLLHGLDDLDYLRSRMDEVRQRKEILRQHFFFDARVANNEGHKA